MFVHTRDRRWLPDVSAPCFTPTHIDLRSQVKRPLLQVLKIKRKCELLVMNSYSFKKGILVYSLCYLHYGFNAKFDR